MSAPRRTDRASRLIEASPRVLYRAYTDPGELVAWRAPEGMVAEMLAFEAGEGGRYRMALRYLEDGGHGKSTSDTDVVEGRFHRLIPDHEIVEVVTFESDDPAFSGEMTITTTFTPQAGGTMVSVECKDVPPGITAEDHQAGIASSLSNLARFASGRGG